MNCFDSHCHLKGFFNKGILEEILSRARENGVSRMAAIGTSSRDWKLYEDLSVKYKGEIFHSVGLHPCYVNDRFDFYKKMEDKNIYNYVIRTLRENYKKNISKSL